ncbi:MAG: hypothetical protein EBS56_13990 [Planctomycetia bacterium]|nr:hypothetical protein [Planctomycetia bacterium]
MDGGAPRGPRPAHRQGPGGVLAARGAGQLGDPGENQGHGVAIALVAELREDAVRALASGARDARTAPAPAVVPARMWGGARCRCCRSQDS